MVNNMVTNNVPPGYRTATFPADPWFQISKGAWIQNSTPNPNAISGIQPPMLSPRIHEPPA